MRNVPNGRKSETKYPELVVGKTYKMESKEEKSVDWLLCVAKRTVRGATKYALYSENLGVMRFEHGHSLMDRLKLVE